LVLLIEIEAVLDDDGVLKSAKAEGHAGAGKTGNDIVCAAVSVLMRTAYTTLLNREGITVRCSAPEPGLMSLQTGYEAEGKDFLFACGAFLVEGLKSIALEYPDNCKLNIRVERRT
jgi:uncharacterized protein YsxB (DUF464 family)